jgi:hypothetical protein
MLLLLLPPTQLLPPPLPMRVVNPHCLVLLRVLLPHRTTQKSGTGATLPLLPPFASGCPGASSQQLPRRLLLQLSLRHQTPSQPPPTPHQRLCPLPHKLPNQSPPSRLLYLIQPIPSGPASTRASTSTSTSEHPPCLLPSSISSELSLLWTGKQLLSAA